MLRHGRGSLHAVIIAAAPSGQAWRPNARRRAYPYYEEVRPFGKVVITDDA
jgi:hypothetical protein